MAVDPKLGHVELIDYVVVEDCGRIINPLTAASGQVIGSVVPGTERLSCEHLLYDARRPASDRPRSPTIWRPTASDFPNIRAVVLEEHPSADQSARRKGVRAKEAAPFRIGGVDGANAVADRVAAASSSGATARTAEPNAHLAARARR